jgi:carbon storage regulator
MLVLSRKKGESILIGHNIEISILESSNDVVKIGIKAPREIDVLRKELYDSVVAMNKAAESVIISEDDLLRQYVELKLSQDKK